MTGTAVYIQGVETNATQTSYCQETTWGTMPSSQAFTALRTTGESLASQRTRQRPSEINQTRSASAAVTTQVGAGGQIQFALSYGSNDDLLSALLGSDWSTDVNLTGTDIAFTAANHITSATANKFQNIVLGQWIKITGAVATSGANNGYVQVTAKASNLDITVAGRTGVLEAAGPSITIKGSYIRNSNYFKSFLIQQKIGNLGTSWLRYPGSYISAASITAGLGQFLSGSFTVISQQEIKATTDASNGTINAAPNGKVIDPINGFCGMWWKTVPIIGVTENLSLDIQNDGAAAQYGMGSAAASGILPGTFGGSGKLAMAFKDFTLYDDAQAEASGTFAFRVQDAAGSSYVFSMPAAVLVNPKITSGGPGQIVKAEFEIEMNPDSNGTHLQIDRFV